MKKMQKYSAPETQAIELNINGMLMLSPDNSIFILMNPDSGAIEDWHDGNIVIGV